MLAQNFKSPADLGLTDAQHAALCKTLVLMETGQLVHVPRRQFKSFADDGYRPTFGGAFNMADWYAESDCGTAACIAGTAEMIGCLERGSLINACTNRDQLYALCMGKWTDKRFADITVPEAAQALRNYLTYGDARGEQG